MENPDSPRLAPFSAKPKRLGAGGRRRGPQEAGVRGEEEEDTGRKGRPWSRAVLEVAVPAVGRAWTSPLHTGRPRGRHSLAEGLGQERERGQACRHLPEPRPQQAGLWGHRQLPPGAASVASPCVCGCQPGHPTSASPALSFCVAPLVIPLTVRYRACLPHWCVNPRRASVLSVFLIYYPGP